ncbi:MAG: hypothetical protein JO253_08065 [Alphaproteobacteria bacterium]|nr:hypothetical protein [Alphaproteobacteria bacterium]
MRENIYAALFALIQAVPNVKVYSRKLAHWADCPEFPALYVHQKDEAVVKTGRRLPSKHTMHAEVYIYVQAPDGVLSATLLNNLVDAVQLSLAPPNPGIENRQTLSGQVEDCWIDGPIMTDEGVLGQTGVAIIPISILVGE